MPDSFNLQIVAGAAADTAGVGMASCADGAAPDEFVGIGGNIYCGDFLAGTDMDATAGVITCNYIYRKVANSRKSWIVAPTLHKALHLCSKLVL